MIFLIALSLDGVTVPDENYNFLSVADSRCIPKVGVSIDPNNAVECGRMTEPKRYRGTWYVAFETSLFTPEGKPTCIEGVTLEYCPDLILEGKGLPLPGRWACARKFQVDFIGRRSVWPGLYSDAPNYRLVADQVISVKRLPGRRYGQDDCDAGAP